MVENDRILVIDCAACGVAGDMVLGALIGLGANIDKIVSAIKTLEKPEYGYGTIQVKIEQVMRGEFKATRIDVTSQNSSKKRASELVNIVEDGVKSLEVSEKAKMFASKAIRTLVSAEADLHKAAFENAHLHEVALVDTAAEIIGVAVAVEDLGLFEGKIYSTPLAVGGGTFKFSHGIVSVPAPATLAILQSKNFPFHGGPIEAELATPTGAAVLVNLVDKVGSFYPAIVPLRVGYGAGTKDYAGLPSVLRLTLGRTVDCGLAKDAIAVLETNVDDVTGEVIGYAIERLLLEGAKDVSVIPMYTKKNRPGQIIKVIAEQKDTQHLTKVLIDETGTLGVRVYPCERHVINREVFMVNLQLMGNLETVKVKVSKDEEGNIIRIKPEFEDLKRLAQKTKKPLRKLMELYVAKAQEKYQRQE